MPTRRDILTRRAILIPIIWNIRVQETRFAQEVNKTVLTELIRPPRDAVIWIAVPHSFVQTAAVSAWAATS